MKKLGLKLKNMCKEKKLFENILTVMVFSFMLLNTCNPAFAAGDYGANAYNWIKAQALYVAFATICIFCIKYIAKKAWAAFAGFAVLGALVLVIIDDPQKLKTIGTTIFQLVFK